MTYSRIRSQETGSFSFFFKLRILGMIVVYRFIMRRHIILGSISGGRSSAVMARLLQTSGKYSGIDKHYIFCNTSRESDETYEFLRRMELDWKLPIVYLEGVYSNQAGEGVKCKTVSYHAMSRDGSLFEDMVQHVSKYSDKGLPHSERPFCSEYLKARVARSFMRDLVGTRRYVTALGYRLEDMPRRVTYSVLRERNDIICPLISDFKIPLSQYDIELILSLNTFDLGHSSKIGNCKICYKASDLNIKQRAVIYPDDADWVRYMEDKYNGSMYRGGRKLDDVLNSGSCGQLSIFGANIDEPCSCGL